MEPVPEAERMEEFRSSPLSSKRLQSSPAAAATAAATAATAAVKASTGSMASAVSAASKTSKASTSPPPPLSTRSAAADVDDGLRKPAIIRRANEPLSPVSPSWGPSLSYRPRTTSPLSGHMRSRSTASVGNFYAPPLGRTQSMPGVNGAGHFQFLLDPRVSSPSLHRPPAINTTARTPRKTVIEDVFPSSPTRMSVIHDLDRRPPLERSSSPNLGCPPSPSSTTSLARTRRPQSPFRRLSNTSAPPSVCPTTPGASETSASSVASSPLYRPYDSSSSLSGGSSYGSSLGMMSSSSVPSTPTSTRSRSPSISSLETIPDSPDAEEEALEAERIAQLKAAAEAADGEAKGRNSLDGPARGRMLVFGPRDRDKRKRWSVCGAERRGDLDLETIWED